MHFEMMCLTASLADLTDGPRVMSDEKWECKFVANIYYISDVYRGVLGCLHPLKNNFHTYYS